MDSSLKQIKSLDKASVLCTWDRCDRPAEYLLIASDPRGACWAYCAEHAQVRAARANLPLPRAAALAAAG